MSRCSTAIIKYMWDLLLLVSALLALAAVVHDVGALPDGFAVEVRLSGVQLQWSSNTTGGPVRMGSSRPEFRLPSGVVFGYPREIRGTLVLSPLSIKDQEVLATEDGQNMEVWSSGRRIDDIKTPANAAATKAAVAAANVTTATPTVSVNPAARGSYNTTRMSYNLAMLKLNSVAFPFPLEVLGEVTQPTVLLQGTVKFPLILFLHGRHGTCYQGGPKGIDSGDWPCPKGWLPIPSHQGYRYVADTLASQGYVVVSISANGINGQDYAASDAGAAARSILIRHHLTLWSQWNTNGGDPWNSRFRGTLDMDKVVLVGHSRGGEGINRAAIDASISDPFKIVGMVSYGPTAFGRQVTPDIHSATILPTCDGDVSDLQGQAYVDASRDIAPSEALRSAVIAVGCNHNYFNTEWTPGLAKAPSFDDWFDDFDPVCGSKGRGIRLTPQEQQTVGSAYTAALVRLAVKQEVAMLPLLDGSYVRPAAIGRADVAVNTVGGAANRLLYRPEDEQVVQLRSGMNGGECSGYSSFSSVPGTSSPENVCGNGEFYSTPHWLYGSRAPQAMELRWSNKPGAYARFNIPSGLTNLTSLDWVDVRVANDPNRGGVRLSLVIIDRNGRNATLPTNLTTVDGWPGVDNLDRVHARTLRGSLASLGSKVDLNNIVAIQLVANSATGRVWVIDIATSQARIQQPVVLDLPVISVQTLTVPEGDGVKTVNVKVITNKALKSPGAIWLLKDSGEEYQIDLVAGNKTTIAQIPYSWVGDKIFGYSSTFTNYLALIALKGVVTGNYVGQIDVVEDDPIPTLSVVSKNVTAKEGQSLEWQFRLFTPTTGIEFSCFLIPPVGTELSTRDVPSSFLQASFITPPSTPEPLSNLGISLQVKFPYGVQSASFIVPIAKDGKAEGKESMACEIYDAQKDSVLTLVGVVSKHS